MAVGGRLRRGRGGGAGSRLGGGLGRRASGGRANRRGRAIDRVLAGELAVADGHTFVVAALDGGVVWAEVERQLENLRRLIGAALVEKGQQVAVGVVILQGHRAIQGQGRHLQRGPNRRDRFSAGVFQWVSLSIQERVAFAVD